MPGLYHIIFISTALFFIGVYGFFTRKNLITMLMSVELILNSVNLNFIAFNKYIHNDGNTGGIFYVLFIIAVSAAETAVAIAIIINLYRNHQAIDIDKVEELKY